VKPPRQTPANFQKPFFKHQIWRPIPKKIPKEMEFWIYDPKRGKFFIQK